MSRREWQTVRLAGTAVLLAVSIHGVTSSRWSELHTLGVILSVAAAIGPEPAG
jgi:hypothetical protein